MGYLYKGDAKFKGSLDVASNKPLDSRSVVQSEEELYTLSADNAYKGMPVVSIDDGAVFLLKDPDNISQPSGWKKIGDVSIDTDSGEIDLSTFTSQSQVKGMINSALASYDPSQALPISDEVTRFGDQLVRSKGIYAAISNMVDAKFVVLSETEYKQLTSVDEQTFYFITA